MELTVSISQDPINNFNRTVRVIQFDWDLNNKFIKLIMWVEYVFDAKGEKNSSRIKNYQLNLVCDNDSIVDENTGEFVLVNDDGIAQSKDAQGNQLTGIGQYDFYIGIAQKGPIDVIGLIKMLVLRADSLKRFDI